MVIGPVKDAWTITLLLEKHATSVTWDNLRAIEWFCKNSKPKIQLSKCKLSCINSNGANSRCQCQINTIIWISINTTQIWEWTKVSSRISNIENIKQVTEFKWFSYMKHKVCDLTFCKKKFKFIQKYLFFIFSLFNTKNA